MILELGDGREIPLPDEMSDETARQLKRLILALEERARTAEATVEALRAEFARVRSSYDGAVATNDALAAALTENRRFQEETNKLLRSLLMVESADRMLITDGIGGARSRVVTRGE